MVENLVKYVVDNIMKNYILLLICILLLNFNYSFAKEKSYNKYLKMEEKFSLEILKPYENDKSLIQKFMLYEDCKIFCIYGKNANTIGKNIMSNVEDLENEPNNINYKYAVKTYDLYKFLCKEYQQYLGRKRTTLNIQNKIIIVPDEDFDKLDKAIITNIILLNSSLR